MRPAMENILICVLLPGEKKNSWPFGIIGIELKCVTIAKNVQKAINSVNDVGAGFYYFNCSQFKSESEQW